MELHIRHDRPEALLRRMNAVVRDLAERGYLVHDCQTHYAAPGDESVATVCYSPPATARPTETIVVRSEDHAVLRERVVAAVAEIERRGGAVCDVAWRFDQAGLPSTATIRYADAGRLIEQ